VSLVGRAVVTEAGAGGREQEAPVQVELQAGASCRMQVELPGGVATSALDKGRLVAGTNPALDAAVALSCPLAALRGVSAADAEVRVAKIAAALGVDSATVSLSRLGRHPAWVVGARPQEPDRPQLWFDKESNRPVRVVAKVGGKVWDVRLLDPASLATHQAHPRLVEVWQNRERLLSLRLMTPGAEGVAPVQGGDDAVDDSD
jgi:hypothetical protein